MINKDFSELMEKMQKEHEKEQGFTPQKFFRLLLGVVTLIGIVQYSLFGKTPQQEVVIKP